VSLNKRSVRSNFRRNVFTRDGYRCLVCRKYGYDHQQAGIQEGVPLDAHHITDRKLFKYGGYVKSNGASLCPGCHYEAETGNISAAALYKAIGSSFQQAVEDETRLFEGKN
jgi:hypothetical protein